MREQWRRFLCRFVCLAALSPLASHAAPQVLRIDGSLFNASGAPITGSRDVQVKAYDAATGGSAAWTSSVYTADVANGRFSIALDATADTTSLTSRLAAKAASGEIWFAIDYDTGTADGDMDSAVTVAPRIRGRGSMFALVAANADTLTGVTATVAEINRLAGVTANIQSQIDAQLMKWLYLTLAIVLEVFSTRNKGSHIRSFLPGHMPEVSHATNSFVVNVTTN